MCWFWTFNSQQNPVQHTCRCAFWNQNISEHYNYFDTHIDKTELLIGVPCWSWFKLEPESGASRDLQDRSHLVSTCFVGLFTYNVLVYQNVKNTSLLLNYIYNKVYIPLALQRHGKTRIRRYALLKATRNLLKVDFLYPVHR